MIKSWNFILITLPIFHCSSGYGQDDTNLAKLFADVDDLSLQVSSYSSYFLYPDSIRQNSSIEQIINDMPRTINEIKSVIKNKEEEELKDYLKIVEKFQSKLIETFENKNHGDRQNTYVIYQEILGLSDDLSAAKYAYQAKILTKRLGAEAIKSFKDKSDTLNLRTDTLNYRIDTLNLRIDTIYNDLDTSLVNLRNALTDFGPFYVGIGWFIENTQSITGLYLRNWITSNLWFSSSASFSVLAYSESGNRKFGASLLLIGPPAIFGDRIYIQLGPEIFPNKQSDDFTVAGKVVFRKRQWALGSSYSIISGFGINLYIAL